MDDDILQIGKTLKTAREKLDLVPQDVHHHTRIPLAILHALEDDDYSVFSSSSYARSYLAQYAEYLHLDASSWLDALEPAEFTHDEYSISLLNDGEVQPTKAQHSAPANTAGRVLPSMVGLVIAVGVLFGGYRLMRSFEQPTNTATTIPSDKNTPPPSPEKKPLSEKTDPAASSISNIIPPEDLTKTPSLNDEVIPPIASAEKTNTEAETPPKAIIIEE